MKGNDIDNVIVPRDVIVWEGLVGLLPDAKTAADEEKWRRRRKWDRAVMCYEINDLMARKIWDLTWRRNLTLDLLTYHGKHFAEALKERIEEVDHLPFSRVWSEDPYVLARRLATMVDVRTVYDPDPTHQFTYGGKGRIIGPGDHELLGV
jgi:hypothetical protein